MQPIIGTTANHVHEYTAPFYMTGFQNVIQNALALTTSVLPVELPIVVVKTRVPVLPYQFVNKPTHIAEWEQNVIVVEDSNYFNSIWNAYITFMEQTFGDVAKQHYWCSTCRRFLTRYGALAYIDASGQLKSLLWSEQVESQAHELYRPLIASLRELVERSNQVADYVAFDLSATPQHLGDLELNGWDHLAASTATARSSTLSTVDAKVRTSKANQAYAVFMPELYKICLTPGFETRLNAMITYLELTPAVRESVPLSQTVLPMALRFREFLTTIKTYDREHARNMVTQLAIVSPDLIAYRNTVLGSLLITEYDETEAFDVWFERTKDVLLSRTDATVYRHLIAEASKQEFEKAINLVAELGYEKSLLQKTATVSDIPDDCWLLRSDNSQAESLVSEVVKESVLDDMRKHLKTVKEAIPHTTTPVITVALNTVTLGYFIRELLPTLKSIRLSQPLTNYGPQLRSDYFKFLLTYSDPDAKPLWAWDELENRCPIAPVAYHGSFIPTRPLNVQEVLGVIKFSVVSKLEPQYDIILRCEPTEQFNIQLPCFWQAYYAKPELASADRALKEYVSSKAVELGKEILVGIPLGAMALIGERKDGTLVTFSVDSKVLE